MKFITSTSSLLKGLQTIGGVINATTVLPILEDFLFELNNDQLSIFATDLETSMNTVVKVESRDTGKVAIPAKMLIETLKTLSEQPLTFSVDEKNYGIEITSETGRYKLTGEDPEDFPKVPEPESVAEISIAGSVLSNAIASTLFATSNDELRPAMTGVLFQIGPEGLTFVSTDAHKLVKLQRHDVKSENEAQFIVPKKALNLMKNNIPTNTVVSINFNKSNAFFSFENTHLICRLIEANYPDYNAVIPLNNPNKLIINRLEFQNALRRVSIFSNKTTYQVVLNIAGSELKISAQDIDFSNEASERLTCTYEGSDMDIAFNARFLIEMLGVIDSAEIELELSTPNRAGLLLPIDKVSNEDLMMLVMPVMINT